ncbi:hypothetical protein B0E43_02570 [Algoriphagus sp. A40]|nr:hypothetical protein B0E43_02570 [Algoriphagus sp. A40]
MWFSDVFKQLKFAGQGSLSVLKLFRNCKNQAVKKRQCGGGFRQFGFAGPWKRFGEIDGKVRLSRGLPKSEGGTSEVPLPTSELN